MQNEFSLDQQVIVITGGSGVLGSAIAQGVARAGAKVAILARNADKIKSVVTGIEADVGQAMGISADVLSKDALEQAARQVIDRWGRIDGLINGAGGNHGDATAMPGQRTFFDLPQDALQWVLDLNFMGSVLASQVFGQHIASQKQGVILNISSMAANPPLTRVVAYAGAKAAINNFTQWLAVYMAQEHSPHIRVNAIAPGFFVGDQNRWLLYDQTSGDLTPRGQQIIDHTPMGRFGDPEDLIGTVIWLLSDAARFVTGIVVPIDGGFSAYSGV